MALTERSRAAFYEGLHAIIDDEEAIGEVLSNFPARDLDEPATKDQLRAESADLRAEMAGLRSDMNAEIAAMRRDLDTGLAGMRRDLDTGLAEVRTEIATLRGETSAAIAGLSAQLGTGLSGVRTEIAQMEQRLKVSNHQEVRDALKWTLMLMIGLFTVLGALVTVS